MSRAAWILPLLFAATASAQAPAPTEPDEDDIPPALPVAPQQPAAPPQQQLPPPVMVPIVAPEMAPPGEPVRGPSRGVLKLMLGGGARSLYTVPFGGADVSFAAGREGPRGEWTFTFDVFAGASSEKLPTTHVRVGFIGAGKMDRLRVGGGARTGLFIIRRITSGDAMAVFTFGPVLNLTYDLVPFQSGGAFLIGGDLGVDAVFFAGTAMFDGSLYFGFRF